MQKLLTALFLPLLLAAPPAFAQTVELDVPEGGYAISSDKDALPPPVRETLDALIAAAKSGDIDELKKLFDAQATPPHVSFGDVSDPIAYFKEISADGKGVEILAILSETLESPFAVMDGGDGQVSYVWPYLAAMPDLKNLTPAQRVDAYRLIGYQGLQDQIEADIGWADWRAFIGPNGELQAFIAGD